MYYVGSLSSAERYLDAWENRKNWFDNLFWNEQTNLYTDWLLDEQRHSSDYYASTIVPLYMYSLDDTLNITTRSKSIVNKLRSIGVFEYPGGLPTSLNESGQQWDFPNAWAPLQWFLVKSFEGSDDKDLKDISTSTLNKWLESTYEAWIKYNNSMFGKVRLYSERAYTIGTYYTDQLGQEIVSIMVY